MSCEHRKACPECERRNLPCEPENRKPMSHGGRDSRRAMPCELRNAHIQLRGVGLKHVSSDARKRWVPLARSMIRVKRPQEQ